MAKIILFIGAPGSGKGSRGKICESIGCIHVSSSQLLRNAGYDLDKSRKIPNEVIVELIKQKIEQAEQNQTIIIDGFPRRMDQVESLEREIPVFKAIYMKISKEEALKRVENRIVCSNCGETYTINHYKHPINEGICDKCGCSLKKRVEDNDELFSKRYRYFKKLTYPVVGYYAKKEKLVAINAMEPNEEIITLVNSL